MQEYQGRVAAEERRLATSGEEYTDEDMSLARLDAGLYTLQQVGRDRRAECICMQYVIATRCWRAHYLLAALACNLDVA